MLRDRALRRTLWTAGSLAGLVALTGCQAIGVRSEDGGGSPLRVAVQSTRGPEVPTDPDDGDGHELPAGWRTVPVRFDCPVEMRVALPPGWSAKGSQPGDLFIASGKGAQPREPRLTLFCSRAPSQSPAEVVESSSKYRYDRRTSTITAQRTYEFSAGSAWVFDIDFTADDSHAAGYPASARGFIAGVRADGKVYQVSLLANAPADDEKGIAQIDEIAAHVSIGRSLIQRPHEHPQKTGDSAVSGQ